MFPVIDVELCVESLTKHMPRQAQVNQGSRQLEATISWATGPTFRPWLILPSVIIIPVVAPTLRAMGLNQGLERQVRNTICRKCNTCTPVWAEEKKSHCTEIHVCWWPMGYKESGVICTLIHKEVPTVRHESNDPYKTCWREQRNVIGRKECTVKLKHGKT